MLRRISHLQGLAIHATDGRIGSIQDVYFDDLEWAVRYFVADTGNWLPGRLVLLAPSSVTAVSDDALSFSLSKQQIQDSPGVDAEQPVSRQREIEVVQYFGWPSYWSAPNQARLAALGGRETETKSHLRSCREVAGYTLAAHDGEVGYVDDFAVDDQQWYVRYLIVATGSWWSGKRVLVAPEWVEAVDWDHSTVSTDLFIETIRTSPEYDPTRPIDRQIEEQLYAHYDRPGYWRPHVEAGRH